MKRILTLFATLLLAALSQAADIPLFDGKTFSGWEGDITNTWRVEDGVLVAGSLEKEQLKNDFLATTKQFANFDLTL